MQWKILNYLPQTTGKARVRSIVDAVLSNRNITTDEQKESFFNPPNPLNISPESARIDEQKLANAIKRLTVAIADKQPVLIYGDYDADGMTATAILWEALMAAGAKAVPFIPNRELHGYGLSVKGLVDALKPFGDASQQPLVITVDNGIVAHEAADFLKEKGIELIITDHHQMSDTLPQCTHLIHTTHISGSGVAWFVAKELSIESAALTLELAAIGTVTDLLPLTDVNRAIVKHGLKRLSQTQRPGLKALFSEAGVDSIENLDTYHIGYVIGPRLNAMGRLEDPMDSLRLLCTRNAEKAIKLAHTLGDTNKTRQDLTLDFITLAEELVSDPSAPVLIIAHEAFHEGVIGLVAGRLSEKYYRPSIVIAKGSETSKASARSVPGINIIELIRTQESLLINAGGHPGAAGFSLESSKVELFADAMNAHAQTAIDPAQLQKSLTIDCQINLSDVDWKLHEALEPLKPFGMQNPEPVFSASNVKVISARIVGRENTHLSLKLQDSAGRYYSGIGFGLARLIDDPIKLERADLAFVLSRNDFNGKSSLQLRVKDIKTNEVLLT
jgi:single-stranded-DNA-specific exonuclease